MNYNEAIQFLYDLRMFGLKFGLENTVRLAELAGRPQDSLRFIHVAGTNGKGSTCAMLESIYRASGLRVGLYTSPHLVSFAERIQVNRQPVSPENVARLVAEIKSYGEPAPTFFEAVTVMALKYFAEQKCDLVIWETGMGGRLDATNIVTPLACAITNVQLDHQQWLGHSVAEIAREKAGIIKERVPIVTAATDDEALRVITDTARERQAPFYAVTAPDQHELGLSGAHQQLNAAVAVKTIEVLQNLIPVSATTLKQGLKGTQWAGRRQTIRHANGQTILLDGAHNPAGAQTLADSWPQKDAALILGIMRDKDCAAVCRILAPLAQKIFLAPIESDRSADPQTLANYCRDANPSAPVTVCKTLAEAFEKTAAESCVVLTGSLYFVGQALELLGVVPGSTERALNEYGERTARHAHVSAVTFDIGGTLIQPWPSVGHVYSRVARRHGIEAAPEILNQKFAAAWKAKRNFNHTKPDWLELVGVTFAGLAGEISPALFSDLYCEFADPAAWRVYDDVRACLETLKQGGFKLGVISNWDERLRPLLRRLDLEKYFDVVVVSCEVGLPKPAPEIFRRATGQLGAMPANILHIGDSRKEDAEGARAAGFQSLLLSRDGARAEDGTIASLSALLERLGGDKLTSGNPQAALISINGVDEAAASH